ncbi:serine/threonine-protein kinase [Kribbella sp. NPDC004536]|uniref:serine/threonine-protein kinase n=1 Tax=Kribbella sp. NPDC004536 TaxID=3364106 RepID=UPI0036D06A1C
MLLAERYRITEILGHGGMGEVYRGCDELLSRPVAVKLLRPDVRDPSAAARLQHEARAAAGVKDPHVVAVYDFGQSDGEYFLVMELMAGRSVTRELALRGPLAPQRAVDIVQQVAAGLAAAHRHGIVHRDIKPDNLLIDVDGSVKIADFGIARSAMEPEPRTPGRILGTSQYVAPERALGHAATAASDVYALGCVLYQLLTGNPPFSGDDPATILSQHVRTAPVVPDEFSAALAQLVYRMLSKSPADRPTAAEVAGWTFGETAEMPTMDLDALPRSKWKALAVAAAVLIAGCALTAGVLTDQDADQPLAPAHIVPPQSPRRMPPPQQTLTPPRPVTTPTVTVTKSATTVRPPSPQHKAVGKGKPRHKKSGKH